MTSVLERAGYPPIEFAPHDVVPGILHGRCPSEGYERGCGLAGGTLSHQIETHPLYQEALKLASGRTIMSVDRLKNIFLIITTCFDRLPSQNIIEFGSYRGGSVFFFSKVLSILYPGAKVYGLDTFGGMPKTDKTIDLHTEGDFADTLLSEIQTAATVYELNNVVFIKGLVQDTFPAQVPPDEQFGLAHIDLDIYSAIKYVQDNIFERTVPGGYIVYDDATAPSCIGATQAVEELISGRDLRSEQVFPHFVFRAPFET